MELTPKELMKQYVDSQNFTSTTQIMQAMKELFRDAIQQVKEEENKMHKPNATILSYPVITSGEFAHKVSFKNLTASESYNDLWELLSLENRVNKSTPPAFYGIHSEMKSFPLKTACFMPKH